MTSSSISAEDHADGGIDKERIWELIRTLVLGNTAPEDILEIYYWSRDSEILAILRAVVALPENSRRQLTGFFASTEPTQVSVDAHSSPRRLILNG
jgi:hypothetical protein